VNGKKTVGKIKASRKITKLSTVMLIISFSLSATGVGQVGGGGTEEKIGRTLFVREKESKS